MTILIAGDSWGCGEWREWQHANNDFGISHAGLAQYCLNSGHQVLNLSKGGSSNIGTYKRVNYFLRLNQHLQIKCVIVFQTDWTRDIVEEESDTITEDLTQGYIALKNRLISRFYYNLHQISNKHNTPVYIVGGCSDAMWLEQFEKEYPGVRVVCQSLTNLLLENNHRILEPSYAVFSNSASKSIKYIKQYINTADLELLLEDINKGHQRLDQWKKNKEFFWPDGVHANQFGHKVLFNFLKDQGIFNEQE